MLIGDDKFAKLQNSHILVVGIGGVGGHAAEILVRSGIGEITLVDGDVVDHTNLNRQIIALQSTLGQPKVAVAKQRLLDINPNCKITALHKRYNSFTANEILASNYNFVVDCIDSVEDKTNLIIAAKQQGLSIISSLGAGNRYNIPKYEALDIFQTKNDGLARALRTRLRKAGIKNHLCVATMTIAEKSEIVKSIAYYPMAAAVVLAATVINKIMEN